MESTTAVITDHRVEPCLDEQTTSEERTFIEFFAGIGLTHLGLSTHGWNCVYANDIEPKKKRMFESRFGESPYYHVENVWRTDKIVNRIPTGRVELATASFPCVDLSLAGNLKGFDGVESGAFYGFIKVLKKLKQQKRLPQALLVENVVGFLTSHKGKFFRAALQEMATLGYYLDAFVVDAKHFVPQSRPRLFVVAFSSELLGSTGTGSIRTRTRRGTWRLQESIPNPLRPERLLEALTQTPLKTGWVPLSLPALPRENRNLERHIDKDDGQQWWNVTLVRKHLREMHAMHRQRMNLLKNGSELTVGTIYRRVRNGKSKSEIRTDGLAGCLRTPRGGSSKQIVFVVGKGKIRMRWMTPREYARLQGCPDFPIEVERNEALFGFGDAVCVPVVSWIAENVLSQIFPANARFGQLQKAAGN